MTSTAVEITHRITLPLSDSPVSLDLEHCQKRFLWNLDRSDLLHPFLTFFLLLQQLALAGDVAAVALGSDVLAQRPDRLALNDFGADPCLDHHFEQLPRDHLFHFLCAPPPPLPRPLPLH